MKTTFIRAGAVVALVAAGMLGLSACGGDGANSPSGPGSSQQGAGQESEEFTADLSEGVKIVNDQIAEVGDLDQIMLASDVKQPTQKYGLWVMPYYPSEAVEKYISTIQIEDGKFVVTATSAETGKVWQMDQDGNISEADKK